MPPLFFIFRALSMATVFGMHRYCFRSEGSYALFFCAFTLTHYALSYFYSRQQIGALISNPSGVAKGAGLLLVAWGAATFGIPRGEVLFGAHHSLSDVYAPTQAPGRSGPGRFGEGIRFILATSGTGLVLSQNDILPGEWRSLFFFALLGSFLLFVGQVGVAACRAMEGRDRTGCVDLLLFEMVGAIPLLLADKIQWYDFAMYHLVFWLYYPAWKRWKVSPASAVGLVLLTLGVAIVLYAFTTAFPLLGNIQPETWRDWVFYFGPYHFILTLALSTANPRFISTFFRTGPAYAGNPTG